MNPAAHSGLRTAVNIETNLALHFRRGDALDFQCPVLCLGQRAAGLLFGFGSNGFGPELRLDAHCFRFGLQRLFACLYDGLTLRLDIRVGRFVDGLGIGLLGRCHLVVGC